MNLTTGAILRRITETPLSVSAHKLATIILDGIAWKVRIPGSSGQGFRFDPATHSNLTRSPIPGHPATLCG